jgi:hypothetical protein
MGIVTSEPPVWELTDYEKEMSEAVARTFVMPRMDNAPEESEVGQAFFECDDYNPEQTEEFYSNCSELLSRLYAVKRA